MYTVDLNSDLERALETMRIDTDIKMIRSFR